MNTTQNAKSTVSDNHGYEIIELTELETGYVSGGWYICHDVYKNGQWSENRLSGG